MLASVLSVVERVLILFVMIFVGYLCGKMGAITKRGAQQLTSILFYVVTPTLIISSLQSMIGQVSLKSLLTEGGLAILFMGIGILTGMLFFRKRPDERKKVLRFAAVYSNCGFMGLPLVEGVLGKTGVAYASMFIVVFNVFVWTHGYASMTGDRRFSWKRIITNPGLTGFVIGIPLFAFSIRLPALLLVPIDSFASMNTPLAMIVIGNFIARVNLKELFQDADIYLLSAIRLLLIPLICFAIILPLGLDKAVATTALILCSAPTAANTAMFAAQFNGDAKLASKVVAFTTLFSMLTMPVFIVLSKFL